MNTSFFPLIKFFKVLQGIFSNVLQWSEQWRNSVHPLILEVIFQNFKRVCFQLTNCLHIANTVQNNLETVIQTKLEITFVNILGRFTSRL